MARALVTGVTGFVGSHLTRALVADGIEVHAVVRAAARLDRVPDLVDAVRFHVDDGTPDALSSAVEAAGPDVTYHLATRFVAEHRPDEVAGLVVDNVGFPTRLADTLARGGFPTFVNVGTAWQHVDGAPYRPKNLYAATKQAFEDVLVHYGTSGGLRPVTVNLFDTYGPRDHRGKLVSALVGALRHGATLSMSSGTQLVDLVHVDDVVRALRLAADVVAGDGAPPTGTYSASSGRACSLRDVVAVLEEVTGRALHVDWGARPERAGEMRSPWDAGPPVPGWAPRIELAEGLARLVAEDDEAGGD